MFNTFKSICRTLIVIVIAFQFAACGGSDAGDDQDPGDEDVTSAGIWEPGVFPDYLDFAAKCELPRSGTDTSGRAFVDVQGTALDEKMWMRSWSNELYLWYDEIIDQDPELFSIEDYFDELVTLELTPSGRPKDNFHFSQNTAEYQARSQSGVSSGYGMRLVIDNTSPRSIVVADVEPDSPADLGGIARGTAILTVDGVSVTSNDVDTLNSGLFPSEAGETHSFSVSGRGSDLAQDITLISADVETETVKYLRTIDLGDTRIGYFNFSSFIFPSEAALAEAIQSLQDADVDELVLDLRYNGGGLLTVASQLAYMIAGPDATDQEIFEVLQFNDKHTVINPVTGSVITPDGFQSTSVGFSLSSGQDLPFLDLDRVFVLAGGNTCSASESVINGLRGIDVEVVLIGKTTCGKPYGFYPFDNCGTTYFSVQFQGANAKGFGEYPDGFSPSESSDGFGVPLPGCDVEDDLTNALGDVNEARLAAALHYIEHGSCPIVSAEALQETIQKGGPSRLEDPLLYGLQPWETSKIYGIQN